MNKQLEALVWLFLITYWDVEEINSAILKRATQHHAQAYSVKLASSEVFLELHC